MRLQSPEVRNVTRSFVFTRLIRTNGLAAGAPGQLYQIHWHKKYPSFSILPLHDPY